MTTNTNNECSEHDQHPLVRTMKKHGIPVTRENFIGLNWLDQPKEWTAEHEAELPEHLQDWSQFDDGPKKPKSFKNFKK
jgi:hypothetical protein